MMADALVAASGIGQADPGHDHRSAAERVNPVNMFTDLYTAITVAGPGTDMPRSDTDHDQVRF